MGWEVWVKQLWQQMCTGVKKRSLNAMPGSPSRPF
ncbi:hypothetical protein EE612_057094 [Oryza sativa]|nr:hypothetical protein EE612_057094 [Oryza sativa]